MTWTRLERRWAVRLFAAILPARPPLPPFAALDLTSFWATLHHTAPPLLHLGGRLAVWFLTWAPVLYVGRFRSLAGLPLAEPETYIARVAASRSFLVRQLLVTLKTLACLAYFADAQVRTIAGGAP